MQYRSDRKGTKLSVLGYGCLRFTKENGKIDIDKTEKEIMEAIRSGVNYFDTAYVYGGSEAALGEILARNGVREQVYIATKLPHYLIKSKAGLEKCFQEQLKRLRTDHVDYYLMHMLNDVQTWQGLCAKGVDQWIREKQASGQICSIGFSYHGNSANFKELLDAYDWDFCQIQYNYLDEHTQAGAGRPSLCRKQRNSGHYHGTSAGRKISTASAGRGKAVICRSSAEADSGRVGISLAVESDRGYGGIVWYEFVGNGATERTGGIGIQGRRTDRGTDGAL